MNDLPKSEDDNTPRAYTRRSLAIQIARGYPVTSAYVEKLLEEFDEGQTRILLDYYSSVSKFPTVEEIKRVLGKGLGRKRPGE